MFKIIIFVCALNFYAPQVLSSDFPLNEIPMYGGIEKSSKEKEADEKLIATIKQRGISLEDASRDAVRKGFEYFYKGDQSTAIKRFNQAWLLNQNNGDAHYGFAMISWARKQLEPAEKFFESAMSMKGTDNSVYIERAKFLFSQNKYADGIKHLEKLLTIYPPSAGVRPMLAYAYMQINQNDKACAYAKETETRKEQLLEFPLEHYCKS